MVAHRRVIGRVVVLRDVGHVRVAALSQSIRGEAGRKAAPAPGSGSLKQHIARYEKELLLSYMEQFDGNVSRMAREMSLSRWGLHKKLEKHGLRYPGRAR